MSQRRWDAEVAEHNPTLTVNGRPNEGDLLYFPLTQDLYEIKFVEREDPFYQLGKIYYYTMTAEIYEYGSDDISTGVAEIDAIETIFSNAIALTMAVGGTGDFTIGETSIRINHRYRSRSEVLGRCYKSSTSYQQNWYVCYW